MGIYIICIYERVIRSCGKGADEAPLLFYYGCFFWFV